MTSDNIALTILACIGGVAVAYIIGCAVLNFIKWGRKP